MTLMRVFVVLLVYRLFCLIDGFFVCLLVCLFVCLAYLYGNGECRCSFGFADAGPQVCFVCAVLAVLVSVSARNVGAVLFPSLLLLFCCVACFPFSLLPC